MIWPVLDPCEGSAMSAIPSGPIGRPEAGLPFLLEFGESLA